MSLRCLFCLLIGTVGLAAQSLAESKGLTSALLARVPARTTTGTPISSLEPGTVLRLTPRASDESPEYETAPDGIRFTLLHLRAPAAPAVRVHFHTFHLPPATRVFVYGANGEAHGPFQGAGPLQSGEFWTRAIAGPDVYVEFQTDGPVPGQLPFRIEEVATVAAADPVIPEEVASDHPRWRTVRWRGEPVQAEERGGQWLLEGDILLESAQAEPDEPVMRRHSFGVSYPTSLWSGGILPYTIDPSLPNQARVTAAVQHWNTQLAGYVKLQPRTTENSFVQFTYNASPGSCYSQVGMSGGLQYINLGDYCSAGNVIHEIGHTLGLWHEHTRADRDGKIIVHTENILSSYSYNFSVQTGNAKLLADYDFSSIMHYPAYAFSSNGLPTIETIPAGISIGQRSSLSAGDIAGVQALYPAAAAAPSTTVNITIATVPAGQPVTVDGVPVLTPHTYSWTPGSSHTLVASAAVLGAGSKYAFTNWRNGGTLSQTVVTPASDTAYTATYATQYMVTTGVSPAGAGAVSVTPVSSDHYYAANTSLSLQVTPTPGYCFSSWTGLAAGADATTQLTVDRFYAITANMSPSYLSVDRFNTTAPADGGSGQININTGNGCRWNAATDTDWIVLQNAANRTGPGALQFLVMPNTTGLWRFGTLKVGANSVVVVQAN